MGRLRLALFAVAASVCVVAFAGEAEWKNHMDAGWAAHQRGDHRTTAVRFQDALKDAEAFGERDVRLAMTLGWLAYVYNSQGRYADAEPLYRRSLAILEKALGPEHPHVAAVRRRHEF